MDNVIFFDGECNLCNGWVQFLLPRDGGTFTFAPLQSDAAEEMLGEGDWSSIVLYQDGRTFRKSTAVLRILKELSWFWPLLYIFLVVPRPLRDWCYDLVARNRYDWFGKRDECMVPDEDVKDRFLT